jgi:hypothetical protein
VLIAEMPAADRFGGLPDRDHDDARLGDERDDLPGGQACGPQHHREARVLEHSP